MNENNMGKHYIVLHLLSIRLIRISHGVTQQTKLFHDLLNCFSSCKKRVIQATTHIKDALSKNEGMMEKRKKETMFTDLFTSFLIALTSGQAAFMLLDISSGQTGKIVK